MTCLAPLTALAVQAMAQIDGLDAVVSTIGGTPADPAVDSQVGEQGRAELAGIAWRQLALSGKPAPQKLPR